MSWHCHFAIVANEQLRFEDCIHKRFLYIHPHLSNILNKYNKNLRNLLFEVSWLRLLFLHFHRNQNLLCRLLRTQMDFLRTRTTCICIFWNIFTWESYLKFFSINFGHTFDSRENHIWTITKIMSQIIQDGYNPFLVLQRVCEGRVVRLTKHTWLMLVTMCVCGFSPSTSNTWKLSPKSQNICLK
jgi:hypothetical protein